MINPKLPSGWDFLNAQRRFRGAMFDIRITRGKMAKIEINGEALDGSIFTKVKAGEHYKTNIIIAN